MTKAEEAKLRQEWQTPPEFMAALHYEFNPFVDVCATLENRKCGYFICPPDSPVEVLEHPECLGCDGLKCDWEPGSWFCNPGFSDVYPWMRKAHIEASENGNSGVLLTHTGVTTDWWWMGMEYAAEVRLLRPRVQFIAPPGIKQSSNSRDTALWVFRRKRPAFGAKVVVWDWEHNTVLDGELEQ